MSTEKRISTKDFESCAMLYGVGLTTDQAGSILHLSRTSVSRVWQAVKFGQEGDYESLKKLGAQNQFLVDWAMSRFNIKPPEAKTEEKTPDNTATAFATLVDAIKDLTNAVNAIDKRLSAMQLTQQGFRGDMSEKIGKVIEAVHVEGDILTKEHTKMVELLGSIKFNTKRGN